MKKERKTKPIKEKKEESTKNIYAKSKRIIYQGNKNMKPITDFFKSEIVLLNQIQMPHLCE
ncbi:hypothetical protein HMPREF9517_00264 [Enterococcus faecalis TX1341]|jgi:hypothetical protein|uniref:Uncharacterized protein n=1 Tax=Enterococcus faecalis ERV63 TaxID=1134793 RepID=A0AAV3GQL3_ENTFL|nr:hypothetical protein BZG32_02770 [Enterococcus faecalis]EEI12915.1 hypothetical protein HMPREF0348_0536 [Enterococcus faecalis TX0104]EEI57100.1 hypothetical protein HMPREF0346_1902 [Enterococcus faecalis EnGen0297]EFM74256.1 hypothetical protein HMPREF9515_00647 [Enterococcus faecalis TX0860]EFM78485.1 hypothetical protein HMPREF9514_02633 [Enterococcus faecalis TX0855]EFT37554.1 hypothetical protein HMPREF9494_02634 [Enterococcus faecalis TX2137]EFU13107.1 hypothetical protein HMPREF9517